MRRALESDEIDEETIRRILEAADKQQDVVELDLPGVKRLLLGLEKKVQANLLKRVKFADEPAKFLDAELELYEEIGNFKVSQWRSVVVVVVVGLVVERKLDRRWRASSHILTSSKPWLNLFRRWRPPRCCTPSW